MAALRSHALQAWVRYCELQRPLHASDRLLLRWHLSLMRRGRLPLIARQGPEGGARLRLAEPLSLVICWREGGRPLLGEALSA